ncbi:TPA: hypothetical protein UL931_000295 [Stenotrophomonas maltophilia]|nr:hypothetical protein [Stenotrophomonas maltophilia]
MNNEPFDRAAPSLPPPMTVGRYVRENFKDKVRPYVTWFGISAPALGAIRIKESGFAWWKLSLIPVAWLLACVVACVVVAGALAATAWWKLHTRINPYIPVTIAMAAAVLGYILVFNFY